MTTLAGVLPETVAGFNALASYASTLGMSIDIANYGGLRTLSDTNTILDYRQNDYNAALSAGQIRPDTTLQEFRPIAPFGSSYHNYGAAFDVVVSARPSSMSYAQALATLGARAPSLGLRWGGMFNNPDPPHFELAISLAEARAKYQAFVAAGGKVSSSPFDLTSFLPGLTSGDDADTQAVFDTPAVDSGADESGDVALASGPDQNGAPTSLLVLGFFVAGFLVWAIRRKLTS